MPWSKKKKYNISNQNTNSKQLNVGTYTKKVETKSNNWNSNSSGLVSSLPKQANTRKLQQKN